MRIRSLLQATLLLATASLVLPALSSSAERNDWNAARDFSLNANPNGAWSYGGSSDPGDTFHRSPVFDHSLNKTGLYSWHGKSSVEPQITLNATNHPVSSFWGPRRLGLHPGSKGATSVVRWSAPREGDYKIRGRFYCLDPKANTDVAVLLVERQLFAARITAGHNAEAFAFDLHFDEDDTIDFSVGPGSDKSYRGDATGLEVSIVSKSS